LEALLGQVRLIERQAGPLPAINVSEGNQALDPGVQQSLNVLYTPRARVDTGQLPRQSLQRSHLRSL
jgi:hypothetical protein